MIKTFRRVVPGAVLLLAAFQLPAPDGAVSDFAGVLPAAREAALEARLDVFERETGSAVVVATVPTLGGRSVEEYATTLFNRWGVRGVLLLVAPNERRARIEVGYGLEDRIPDAAARRIMDDRLVPHFRRGDFAGGIDAAVDALLATLAGPGPPLTAERLPDDPATVPTAESLFAPGTAPRGTRDPGARARSEPRPLRSSPAGEDTGEGTGGGPGLGIILALAAALGGAGWGVVRVRERRRRAALRKRLREHAIPARIDAGDQARRALEEICGRAAELLPLPADQERIAGAGAVIAAAVRDDDEELDAALALVGEDPDGAAALLDRAEGRHRILAFWGEIENRIDAYRNALRDGPAAVEQGSEALSRAGAACDAAERDGYRTPRGALGEAEAGLERARALLAGTPPDPEAAIRAARGTVDLLRARHPAPVWEAVARDVYELAEVLETAARRLDEAERANGMDVQDFTRAHGIVHEVERTLARAEAATRAPSAVLAAQEEAARDCATWRRRSSASGRPKDPWTS